MRDVARNAGVDPAVVSRVLRNDPNLQIRSSTRERVLRAVAELGYRPNAAARSLRTSTAGAYGLLIPDFHNPVYASVIAGAEAEALSRGSVLLTASAESADTDAFVEMARQGRVDGLLLAGSDLSPGTTDELSRTGVPWLRVNRRTEGLARYVVLDDVAAASMAVRHLVDLGHREIAHVAGPPKVDTAERRRQGWLSALQSAGLPSPARLCVTSDYSTAGGAGAMAALLSRQTRPTAIFAANGAMAIGALYSLAEAGLRVPRDVSVVTIDDQPLFQYLRPPLTAVSMPLGAMGALGIQLLATGSATEPVEEVIRGPMHLVRRASTSPFDG